MATMRELKRRIDSVHSSQKITGAMKMISSARLRKAEAALNHALPYEEQLQSILDHIQESDCDYVSPLRQTREVKKISLVALASDEGMCGAFNINVQRKVNELVKTYYPQVEEDIEVYPVGKKIIAGIRRTAGVQIRDIPALFAEKKYAEGVTALVKELINRFLEKKTDRVEVVYTHFKSMGTQTVVHFQLLPLLSLKSQRPQEQEGPDWQEKKPVYIYEPDCRHIFDVLFPLIIRTMFYKALLESQTSEQAARVMAMQFANDNAIKLLGRLQLEYNKLRQQGITTELLDMAGGMVQD